MNVDDHYIVVGGGRHNTKLPDPCENEEKEDQNPVCERRKEEKAPHVPTVS